jgi:1-pyrroline-5-carboxylate dehydrogenase
MLDVNSLKFHNEPLTDFSRPDAREAMVKALAQVRAQLGQSFPLSISGKKVKTAKRLVSINPSRPKVIVGMASDANRSLADRALESATKCFPMWSGTPAWKRAEIFRKMARLLGERKHQFSAWMIYEVGKSWAEADADVAEAIDFLDYYAELALLPSPVLTPVVGEKNEYRYLPIGPVVVIPPWNFPLAILVGMTSAALLTGNTVVLKPSSQSPIIAAQFVNLAEEAGLPPGVLNFLTGAGGAIGDFLVSDPRTRMIAFTGSKSVGLHINALAAQTSSGQRWVKRVIAEMGGKNAIIVDESANLDAAAQGALASAFGYQGQKCSACSRLYVHKSVYADFVERLLGLARKMRQGPSDDYENFMGPVISDRSRRDIERYVAIGKKEGRLLHEGATIDGGYFVPPTIFDRLPRASRLFSEEIFGPVLAIEKVTSFDQALELANSTDYGLTGAVYSADPDHLEKARNHFFCGNLYLNRKCTGAMVGGHPFGGFNMSGTDSKAGGPDYLLLFTQAKCISAKNL